MKRFYSFLLLLMLGVGLSFQASAAVTVKVNETGIGVLYFYSFGSCVNTVITSAETDLPNDCGGSVVGEIHCPAGYTMTAVNETNGSTPSITDYDGEQYISVNPGTAPNGTVFNITVREAGGGGGGEDPADMLTFVFSPAGSGYVVTTHANDAGVTVEDITYKPEGDDDSVQVPYSSDGSYIIKPNTGFALLNAKDESQTSNPHYSGDTPRGDGYIYGMMTSLSPNSTVVVTATRNGSFSVKAEGEGYENIQMQNLSTYDFVTVTNAESNITFTGGTTYKIYSSSSSPIWKVDVTDAEDYTTSLSGNYGNFFYTPNDGDKVVIFPTKPQMYCKFNLSFSGEGIDNSIIKSVWYGDNEEDTSTWSGGSWTKEGEDFLRIYFNSGYSNLSVRINGSAVSLSSDSQGTQYVGYQVSNGSELIKDYDIVVSAEKEKSYNLTLLCENPAAVQVTPMIGYSLQTPLAFTQSGQTFQIKKSSNKLKFVAVSGWTVDGILIDGELPEEGEFTDGVYFVNSDCTVTINVSNLADKRTKTATVYVDESVANPMYLDFKYADQTSVTITPGYNFVPFCDDDLPLSFGYYAGGTAEFYVNGQKIDLPNGCPQTIELEDGAVIKYFNGTPIAQVVTYDIKDDVAELIEIFHDYTTGINHSEATEYACFSGTLIHIKAKEVAQSVASRAGGVPFDVMVDGDYIEADENGVYTVKVGDTASKITIGKDLSALDNIYTSEEQQFNIVNLQGVVVKRSASVEDIKNLPAGIYIANGKKLIKK